MKKNIKKIITLLLVGVFFLSGSQIKAEASETLGLKLDTMIFIQEGDLTKESLAFLSEEGISKVFFQNNPSVENNIAALKKQSIASVLVFDSQEEISGIKSELDKHNIKEVGLDFSKEVVTKDKVLEKIDLVKNEVKTENIYIILNKENYSLDLFGEGFTVMARIDETVNRMEIVKDFTFYIDRWREFSNKNEMEIIPLTNFDFETYTQDQNDILAKGFYLKNNFLSKRNQRVALFGDFTNEKNIKIFKDKFQVWTIKSLDTVDEINMNISSELSIERPEKNISVSSKTYNIFGTSNPNTALYCGGEVVSNRGGLGSFAHLVTLELGENVFSFTQGEQKQSITITRFQPKTTQSEITTIIQESMLPKIDDVVSASNEYNLKCVAPSGGVVSVKIGDYTVNLKQQALTEKSGVPATFRGTLQVGANYSTTEIKSIGKVTYYLTYNGITSSYESSGDLYIAGSDTKVGAIATRNMVNMYRDLEDVEDYGYSSTLDLGQWDYIVDSTEDFFQLSMGDFVKKSDVTIIDGGSYNKGNLKNIEYNFSETEETIRLIGIKDCVKEVTVLEDGKINIILYGVDTKSLNLSASKKTLELYLKKSEIFQEGSIDINEEKDSIEILLSCKNQKGVWGYGVEQESDSDEKSMWVYFKKSPHQSGIKPLEGKMVIIDPGHGGYDPGALGTAYTNGPKEKDLTLKISLYTKQYLEDMGATVLMIRENDTFLTIYERAALNEKIKPDIFVSVHINSVDVSSDGLTKGTEIYYYNQGSKNLAENILSNIEKTLGRKNRGAKSGAYVVARPTSSPSVLCEIGFMSNPDEYEEMANQLVCERTGEAIAQGVKDTIIQGGYYN